MWQILPQIGLYTNVNILSMVYEIISALFWTFMQLSKLKQRQRKGRLSGRPSRSDRELGLSLVGNVQMVIGQGGDTAAAGGPGQEA